MSVSHTRPILVATALALASVAVGAPAAASKGATPGDPAAIFTDGFESGNTAVRGKGR